MIEFFVGAINLSPYCTNRVMFSKFHFDGIPPEIEESLYFLIHRPKADILVFSEKLQIRIWRVDYDFATLYGRCYIVLRGGLQQDKSHEIILTKDSNWFQSKGERR